MLRKMCEGKNKSIFLALKSRWWMVIVRRMILHIHDRLTFCGKLNFRKYSILSLVILKKLFTSWKVKTDELIFKVVFVVVSQKTQKITSENNLVFHNLHFQRFIFWIYSLEIKIICNDRRFFEIHRNILQK